MHIHIISVVQMINGSLKYQLLRQKWLWEIVLFLVLHLRFGTTFRFRLGNPNQLFHLRLSWEPTCLCKLFLTHKCQLFHCTLLGKWSGIVQAMELFSRSAVEYICIVIALYKFTLLLLLLFNRNKSLHTFCNLTPWRTINIQGVCVGNKMWHWKRNMHLFLDNKIVLLLNPLHPSLI